MSASGAPFGISADLQLHLNKEFQEAITKLCTTQDQQLSILNELKLAVHSNTLVLQQLTEERKDERKNRWDIKKSIFLLAISTAVSAFMGYMSGSRT